MEIWEDYIEIAKSCVYDKETINGKERGFRALNGSSLEFQWNSYNDTQWDKETEVKRQSVAFAHWIIGRGTREYLDDKDICIELHARMAAAIKPNLDELIKKGTPLIEINLGQAIEGKKDAFTAAYQAVDKAIAKKTEVAGKESTTPRPQTPNF